MTEDIIIGFLGGVIIPLTLIYLLNGLGIVHFRDKITPAIIIIAGSLILIVAEETSKEIIRIIK